jgi:hypothetical protein
MPEPEGTHSFGRPLRFVPQRHVAVRRLAAGMGIAAAALAGAVVWLLM